MFLDDLNKTDNSRVVSPLSHDYDGRFSRKGQKLEKKFKDYRGIESIFIIIFCLSLLATDFILFAGSGNVEVFHNSVLPIPEVLLSLLCLVPVVSIIVWLLNKHSITKYAFASFITFGFVYAMFNQFSQMQQTINLGSYNVSTYIVVGIILAAIVFAIFAQDKILFKGLLTLAAIILFADVYVTYMRHTEPHEFVESHNSQTIRQNGNKRFIYFMFPNLVSYSYLNGLKFSDAQYTKHLIQGFYQKNGFTNYPQAYTPEHEYLSNMVISFNPMSNKHSSEHLLKTRILSEYWRFRNLRTEYIYLKDNQLYDIFKKNKFQISAYKSRDFDMCHVNHKINVTRCIEKINQPTNIYSMSLSTWEKTKILMVEWLSSMHLLTNMSSIYHTLASVIDADRVPMVGVDYNNLYVVNSIKTFDILFDDILKDSGRQAYFVFADIPSNMYIYDEYCRLKPQEEWLDMANLPWIKTDYTEQRQTAYLQQTRCLYGKLEEFIDKLREKNLWDDTVVVIQGTSGVNNFQNYKYQDFIDNFMANRLVGMAIHDKHQKKAEVNMGFCPTNNILSQYLFHPKEQCEPKKLDIHGSLYEALRRKLYYLSSRADIDHSEKFTKWYAEWLKINTSLPEDEADIFKKQNTEFEDEEISEEDFGIDDLNFIDDEAKLQGNIVE